VDRIRRSEYEDPMGLFTYDSDMLIDWNDNTRRTKTAAKVTLKNRLLDAARKEKGGSNASETSAAARAAAQEHIPAGNQVPHHAVRKGSKDLHKGSVSAPRGGRRGSAMLIPNVAPVTEAKDEGEAAEEEDLEKKREKAKEAPTIVLPKYTQDVWTKDEDIVELRHRVNDSFRALWENGIAAYINGDWQKARDIFHETMRLSKNKDGPSKFLMEIIDEHGGSAPHEWPGYRADY
jgi:hypothetical protein